MELAPLILHLIKLGIVLNDRLILIAKAGRGKEALEQNLDLTQCSSEVNRPNMHRFARIHT